MYVPVFFVFEILLVMLTQLPSSDVLDAIHGSLPRGNAVSISSFEVDAKPDLCGTVSRSPILD